MGILTKQAGKVQGPAGLLGLNTAETLHVLSFLYVPCKTAEVDRVDRHGMTALLCAAHKKGPTEIVAAILNAGANTEIKDRAFGMTALLWASHGGRADAVTLLLEAGADLQAKSKAGLTSLAWASANGHIGVLAILAASYRRAGDHELLQYHGEIALNEAPSDATRNFMVTCLRQNKAAMKS
jgi:ankyrin repeat protein